MEDKERVSLPTHEDVTALGEAPAAEASLESPVPQAGESLEELRARLADREQELQRKEADLERLRKIGSKKANENFQLRKQTAEVLQLRKDFETLGKTMAAWIADLREGDSDEYEEARPKRRDYKAELEEGFKKSREATTDFVASPEVEELFGYVQSVGLAPNDPMVLESMREAGGDPEFTLEKLRAKVEASKTAKPAKPAANAEPDVETRAKEMFEKWKAEMLQPGARQPVTPGALSVQDIEKMSMEQYAEFRRTHPNV